MNPPGWPKCWVSSTGDIQPKAKVKVRPADIWRRSVEIIKSNILLLPFVKYRIIINGTEIEKISYTKLLGVHTDKHISWD